ncbi:MAG: 50S ribosomal protein L29 [Bacteroidota bacterium]
MKAKEIRDLSTEEITERIREEETHLGHLRFQHAVSGQIENPLQLREKRRTIARLKTILNERG